MLRKGLFAAVGDARFPCEDVVRDDSAAHAFAEFDLRLVFTELAAAHEDGSALGLNCVATFLFAVPLDKSAIAEADSAAARDLAI